MSSIMQCSVGCLGLSLICCLSVMGANATVRIAPGHYPATYCTFTDVVLNVAEDRFFYKADRDLNSNCKYTADIWPPRHEKSLDISAACEHVHKVGHAFTIIYWAGDSNYYHLHYDMLIPLYRVIYHETPQFIGPDSKHVFMPTVETRRLQVSHYRAICVLFYSFVKRCFRFRWQVG